MAKLYTVTVTLEVTEQVVADNKEDAEQAFSELFSSGEELLEYATYKVKCIDRNYAE